jgi:ornithine cyclodeaminase
MTALAKGEAYQPLRGLADPPALDGLMVLKPAWVGAGLDAFGVKVVSLFPGNAKRGLAAVQGLVALVDPETGVPTTIVEGATVTELRTAAVSAVATDVMAAPDAGDLAIVGAGVQGRAHLLAMREVRSLRRVRVWNRTPERAQELASWAAGLGIDVEVIGSLPDALAGADLICIATTSSEPLVDGDWVADGAHINAVGAFRPPDRELHSNAVARAHVVVDSRESALAEAGDLLFPIKEGLIDESHITAELGEVLLGARPGRGAEGQVTLYKSLGLAVQDVAAAQEVVRRARELGLGVEVSFP